VQEVRGDHIGRERRVRLLENYRHDVVACEHRYSPVSQSLLSEREISICASGLFVFLHAGLFVARAGVDGIDLGVEKMCVLWRSEMR
jgi:hypothetical protein